MTVASSTDAGGGMLNRNHMDWKNECDSLSFHVVRVVSAM